MSLVGNLGRFRKVTGIMIKHGFGDVLSSIPIRSIFPKSRPKKARFPRVLYHAVRALPATNVYV
ncbi:MAG: hypothetical protein M0D57_17480 [Sphingobacteriales bacterium JAD_PAG50586_3]|nr:MAG: hypothetical protein M0D57_17480 [Sphingobacteriales bacterium JAD_PAG50586_3]